MKPQIGKEYDLVPDARTYSGMSLRSRGSRVKVLSGPDGDGDYDVEFVDGDRSGSWYVKPDQLVLGPAGRWPVGQRLKVLVDKPDGANLYSGDVVEYLGEAVGYKGIRVEFVSGSGCTWAAQGSDSGRGWIVQLNQVEAIGAVTSAASAVRSAADLVVGREYLLTEGAKSTSGYSLGRARCRLLSFSGGEYHVDVLSGPRAGRKHLVRPEMFDFSHVATPSATHTLPASSGWSLADLVAGL